MIGLSELSEILETHSGSVADPDVVSYVLKGVKEDLKGLESDPDAWKKLTMLWPPRLVEGYRENKLVPFFGAGVSFAADLPSWNTLLSENFGLSPEFLEDKDLENDPLTLAELAAQSVGSENIQNILHNRFGSASEPTSAHLMLCNLKCPVYITTNYDDLLEKAWRLKNGKERELHVITSDLSIDDLPISLSDIWSSDRHSILIKIHGCATKTDEKLVLTRKDYRHHYRSNPELLKLLNRLLSKEHVLFLGFSHKDPEVSRLVEDSIFDYEMAVLDDDNGNPDCPHFYSLQFNMLNHTPEVYAARGLVALRPPVLKHETKDTRGAALSIALAELILAGKKDTHSKIRLDHQLVEYSDKISSSLTEALNILEKNRKNALLTIDGLTPPANWMEKAVDELSTLAGQGLWLLDCDGEIRESTIPSSISSNENKDSSASKRTSFEDRPYFRQAKTYRKPFVSDSTKSIFNGNSTFFICLPIVDNRKFMGLLFSACQVGAWNLPLKYAKECWENGLSFVLVDSNGVALVSPNDEVKLSFENSVKGYPYEQMLSLSRRDFLISDVAKNIVPVSQDDEISIVSSDVKIYSVISEVRKTSWKLCLARTIVDIKEISTKGS